MMKPSEPGSFHSIRRFLQGEASPVSARYMRVASWFQKENYRNALGYFEQVARQVGATSGSMEIDAFVRSADCQFMLRDFARAGSMRPGH